MKECVFLQPLKKTHSFISFLQLQASHLQKINYLKYSETEKIYIYKF